MSLLVRVVVCRNKRARGRCPITRTAKQQQQARNAGLQQHAVSQWLSIRSTPTARGGDWWGRSGCSSVARTAWHPSTGHEGQRLGSQDAGTGIDERAAQAFDAQRRVGAVAASAINCTIPPSGDAGRAMQDQGLASSLRHEVLPASLQAPLLCHCAALAAYSDAIDDEPAKERVCAFMCMAQGFLRQLLAMEEQAATNSRSDVAWCGAVVSALASPNLQLPPSGSTQCNVCVHMRESRIAIPCTFAREQPEAQANVRAAT